MKVSHPDGRPLLILTWPLIRTIDMNLHLCGSVGALTIKVRKGRVAGFDVLQQTLWEAAEAA